MEIVALGLQRAIVLSLFLLVEYPMLMFDLDSGMDLSEKSDRQLKELANVVLVKMAEIKTKIANAKARKFATGVWADPQWFAAVSSALTHTQVLHQRILTELATRKKNKKEGESDRENGGNNFYVSFHRYAKEFLPEEVYRRISEAANGEAS